MGKNKKYYKNNYRKNNKNNNEEKKVTYDSLMHAKTITEKKSEPEYDRYLVMKCVAISVVLFAIIIGSFILFVKM